MRRRAFLALAVAAALGLVAVLALVDAAGSRAQDARYIVVQSTTSTENSGLFKHLLPMFTARTGIEVRVVAVGTGQAIKNAQNGDGDVLFVHDKPSEEKFVAEGWGVKRFDVMYNDFVVIGPAKDPAGIAGARDVVAALQARSPTPRRRSSRAATTAARTRRSCGSGRTRASTPRPRPAPGTARPAAAWAPPSTPASAWAPTCSPTAPPGRASRTAATPGSWSRATRSLFNQYGVMLVNPARHPQVKQAEGQAFIDWVLSAEGQGAIRSFQINGEQQFFPNASPTG